MKLGAEQRLSLPDQKFGLPEERKYPINDLSHARNALSRVAQFGSPEEKAAVRKAVYNAWPDIAQRALKRTGQI